MSTRDQGLKSLSQLRTLLQALADQLDDSDDDRTRMSREAMGTTVPGYLVAQTAPAAEQAKAAEAITRVSGFRSETVRAAVEVVDALTTELGKGDAIDYKQIEFPGLEELLA